MSTTAILERLREEEVRYDFLGTLKAGWRAMQSHRRMRRELVALSRLSPHLIRDIGFDPKTVYEALEGSWDEIDPGNPWRFLSPDGRL